MTAATLNEIRTAKIMLPNPNYDPKAKQGDPAGQRSLSLGLCLSGGGFRAALFHLGVMRGLDRVGLLSHVDAISAVSGGAILAAAYGIALTESAQKKEPFEFKALEASMKFFTSCGLRNQVLLRLAKPKFFFSWALKGRTRTDLLADEYDKTLFHGAKIGESWKYLN